MNEFKLKDTIIFLKEVEDPLFGSIIYHKPAKPNTVITIKSPSKTVKLPLNRIKLAMFRLDFLRYGLIFKSKMYFDFDVHYWDRQTKAIASHKLKANFHPEQELDFRKKFQQ